MRSRFTPPRVITCHCPCLARCRYSAGAMMGIPGTGYHAQPGAPSLLSAYLESRRISVRQYQPSSVGLLHWLAHALESTYVLIIRSHPIQLLAQSAIESTHGAAGIEGTADSKLRSRVTLQTAGDPLRSWPHSAAMSRCSRRTPPGSFTRQTYPAGGRG